MAAGTLVVDVGSGLTKGGMAGNAVPRWHKPSLIKGKRVMQRGIVESSDLLEQMLHDAFYNEMRLAPEEHPLLCVEHPLRPKQQRERITQSVFETYNCPGFYLACSPVMGLIATGRTTGVGIDLGYGLSSITPVYEGCALPHAMIMLSAAMEDVVGYVKVMLERKGISLANDHQTTSQLCDMVAKRTERILETLRSSTGSKTPQHFSSLPVEILDHISRFALRENDIESYKLPDGQVVDLGQERIVMGELLFNPALLGHESQSVIESVDSSIRKCDICIRPDLYCNIVLTGGNSVYPGMEQRIKSGVQSRVSYSERVRIISPTVRQFGAWTGGSMLASLSTFNELIISKDSYDEVYVLRVLPIFIPHRMAQPAVHILSYFLRRR